MLYRIKKLLGLVDFGPEEIKKIEDVDLRAAFYATGFVILLELYMIYRILMITFFGTEQRTFAWVMSHLSSYLVLLAAAVAAFIQSHMYRKGRRFSYTRTLAVQGLFCIVSLAFGIYISAMDYSKGEQILAFITMMVFMVCVYTWHPLVVITVTTFAFFTMYYQMSLSGDISLATNINFFTAWVAITMGGIKSFHNVLR